MGKGVWSRNRQAWHRKASAKNSSKLNKFLHSEVNLLIQHIIVQDQDGQNNMCIFRYEYIPPHLEQFQPVLLYYSLKVGKEKTVVV